MAQQLHLSKSISSNQIQLFHPLGALRGTGRVSFAPRTSTFSIKCGVKRYDLGKLRAKDFPGWVTKEPKAMKMLYILVQIYEPIVKAQLIFAVFLAICVFIYTHAKKYKPKPTDTDLPAQPDQLALPAQDPPKVKSSASAHAQKIRRDEMNQDLHALRAAVPFITTSKRSLIQASLEYINLLEDKIKALEKENVELKSELQHMK